MKEPLFRQAAVAHQGQQKWGELFLSQPLKLQLLMWAIAFITALALVLLWSGEYQRKVSVSGILVPEGGVITLNAPNSATVVELYTSHGVQVARGQALMRLAFEAGDQGNATADRLLQSLNTQLVELLAQRRDEQAKQARQAGLFSLKARQLQVTRQQLTALQAQYEAAFTLRHNAVIRARQLLGQGTIAIADVEALEGLLLESKSELTQLQMQLGELELTQDTQQLEQDIELLESQQAIARLNTREAELQQMQTRVEQEKGTQLTAPVAGRVSSSALRVGMSVPIGAPLLSIVPESSSLFAELAVPSNAIGFLQPGQPVSLRLAAFPYQKFGSIGAVVQEVAASSNLPDGAASYTEQFYRVTAVLESQNVMAYGRQQSLLPGMTLEADISLDHRSLLEWLLEPLFSIKGRL